MKTVSTISFSRTSISLSDDCSGECELKLADVSQRITSTETTLALLECKLRSIPGLEYDGAPPPSAAAATTTTTVNATTADAAPAPGPAADVATTAPPAAAAPAADDASAAAGGGDDVTVATTAAAGAEEEEAAAAGPNLAEDPQYGRYIKMLKMHVPRMAVEMKMTAEGLDPSLIQSYVV
jgi:hypothetical protein